MRGPLMMKGKEPPLCGKNVRTHGKGHANGKKGVELKFRRSGEKAATRITGRSDWGNCIWGKSRACGQ